MTMKLRDTQILSALLKDRMERKVKVVELSLVSAAWGNKRPRQSFRQCLSKMSKKHVGPDFALVSFYLILGSK